MIPFPGKFKKNRTCVLHIGMAKTGTTSIQFTLSDLCREGPVQYAMIRRANPNLLMSVLFSSDPAKGGHTARLGYSVQEFKELKKSYTKQIVHFIENSVPSTLVFSSEEMSGGHFLPDGPATVRKFFAPYFDRFHIIAYIRAPVSNACSAAQQILKGQSADIYPSRLIPDYRYQLEPWINTFSDQKITFKPFKPSTFPNGDVVLDFARTVGLDISPEEVIRKNESLSLEAVALLYAERMSNGPVSKNKEAVAENIRMQKRLGFLKGGKFVWSEEYLRPAIEARADSIRWIEDYLGEDFSGEDSQGASVIDHPDQFLAIAREAEPGLYRFVDKNIEPLNGQPKTRSELFEYLGRK